jgi:hypothetical protein
MRKPPQTNDIPTMCDKINEALAAVEKELMDEHPELVARFRDYVTLWEAQVAAMRTNCMILYAFKYRSRSEMIALLNPKSATENVLMTIPDDEVPRC